MFEKYVLGFYDDCNVDLYVKQNLDELEHPSLITECTSNIDKATYKGKSEKDKKTPEEK